MNLFNIKFMNGFNAGKYRFILIWRLFHGFSLSASLHLIVLLLLFFFCRAAEGAVVARVGDTEITEAELDEALSQYVPRGGLHSNVDRSRKIDEKRKALDNLIEFELLYKEAVRQGHIVTEKTIHEIEQQNIQQFGSEKAFHDALQERGYTPERFRDSIKKFQTVVLLFEDMLKESSYSEEDARAYFDKNSNKFQRPEAVRIYHILVQADPASSEDVWLQKEKAAQRLLERIQSGEDFGAVAYEASDDPYKFKQGDLGFIHKGRLTPQELEDAAFALKEGEVSRVIRTIYGFHILKAGERKPAEKVSFEDIKDKLMTDLRDRKFEERKKEMVETLKTRHPVTIYAPYESK